MIAQHELLNQAARLIDQAGCGPRWANTTARSTPPTCGARTPSSKAAAPRARWCWKASDSQGRSPGRPPAGFLRRATRITTRKRLKPRLRDARWQPRTVRRTPLLAHMLDQALEPSLWAMVALTLLLLRFVPLQGWLAVLVAGTTSGLILTPSSSGSVRRACGMRWSAPRCWPRCWSPPCSRPCTRCSGATVAASSRAERHEQTAH